MAAFLILSGIAVVWVLSLLVHPFGRCIRCQGKGNIVRGNRRPIRPLCHGTRRRQRFGSKSPGVSRVTSCMCENRWWLPADAGFAWCFEPV